MRPLLFVAGLCSFQAFSAEILFPPQRSVREIDRHDRRLSGKGPAALINHAGASRTQMRGLHGALSAFRKINPYPSLSIYRAMQPITPVVPGFDLPVTTYAKDQPEYNPLPCYLCENGTVVTRWRLTWRERLRILIGGSLWLSILTFHQPLQPVKLDTECPIIGRTGQDREV